MAIELIRRHRLIGASATALAIAIATPVFAQEAPSADTTADIVVTGARAAELRSLELKRANNAIVESIVADDVGKLPDQNVAEAVKRLPGLSVANDQGEGRYVIIRGVNPNLVNVTVNGMTQPAPEPDGRQVKLDDIPSALIAAVTISKSLTADQDANAIGGAVDIRTLSAFDRKEHFFFTARGEVGKYELNHKSPYSVDGQIGGRFGDFGAVLSVSKSRRPIESENFQGSETFLANGGPDQFGLRDYNLVRDRTGVVLNLDYQPSPALSLFLRSTYSEFSDSEFRDQNRVDSIVYTGTTTGTYRGRPSILIRRRIEKDNTKSLTGGGNFGLGESTLSVTGSYASAVKNDPLRSEYNFRGSATGATSVTGNFDITDSPYLFTFNPSFPTNLSLNSVNYDHRHAQEDLWQVRADYTVPIGFGDDSTIKIGAKYLNRHKTNDRDYQVYGLTAGQTFTAANVSYVGDTDFYEGRYILGPRIDYNAAEAYVAAHPGILTQSAANLVTSRNNSLVNDYDVHEKILAAYAMATLKFGNLTIIPGVRVEKTVNDAAGKVITATSTPTQGYNNFAHRSYTYVLPGINVKWEPVQNLFLRGAVTTSIARPNYPDLSAYISIDTTTATPTITKGNPDIQPYKALNLDLTAEYYFPKNGGISVGLFQKTIDNPIYTQTLGVTNYTIAGQTFATANVIQAVNATKAVIHGIELNAQYQFTFLPGFLGGFGVAGNLTLVDGHGEGLLNRVGDIPLFFQAKRTGSAQLTYEKYGLTARLAYSYRSRYLDLLGSANATQDEYTDNNGQLDGRVGYEISRNFSVYVEGSNLTDAPWRRFIGNPSQLVEREHYGTSWRVGGQVKF